MQSNKPGFVTFANTGEPDSRSTQLFINYIHNANLDALHFAPIGEVLGDGMEVFPSIRNTYAAWR